MIWRGLLSVAAFAGLAASQVTTDCNPMNKTCDPNPAFGTDYTWNFNSTPNGQLWETHVGPVHYEEDTGARFSIEKQGDSPTIRTKFYIFFGRVEFFLKAAKGAGIVSSMMLLSDNLDEIDWEFTGVDERASTNFFGKGIEDWGFGEYHEMDPPAQDDFHNYTTIWTEEKLEFWLDEKLVRTVKPDEARINDTEVYPQTPCRLYLGIWAGGDPGMPKGTREWAGGDTDYDAGPYDMFVRSAHIEDYSSGKEYVWGDRSGSWESIEVVEGNSTAVKTIFQEPEKSLNDKFHELPQPAKVAVYAGGAAVAGLIIGAGIFYCIKQRRRGAKEARIALQRSEAERMELNQLKKDGVDPDGFTEHSTEYNPRQMKDGGVVGTTYYNVPNDDVENEKAWGAAGAAAGAAGGVAALRKETQSPAPSSIQSPVQGGFPTYPSATHPGSPGSPGPQQAYGAGRMQQEGRSFSDNFGGGNGYSRIQSPDVGPMSPQARSFSDNYNQGYGGPNQGPYGQR